MKKLLLMLGFLAVLGLSSAATAGVHFSVGVGGPYYGPYYGSPYYYDGYPYGYYPYGYYGYYGHPYYYYHHHHHHWR